MKSEKGSSKITIFVFIILILIISGAYWYFCIIDSNDEKSGKNTITNTTGSDTITKNNVSNSVNEENNVVENANSNPTSSYTFKNEFGDCEKSTTIQAEQCFRGSGYAGASSNVYYLKDGVLYHLELANLNTEKLATGVQSLEEKNIETDGENGIIAKVSKDYKVEIENSYITYQQQ